MLGFRTKKHTAVNNWRSRARLINPNKTKLILINTRNPTPTSITGDTETMGEPETTRLGTEVPNMDSEENTEPRYEISGTPVSFEPVDD